MSRRLKFLLFLCVALTEISRARELRLEMSSDHEAQIQVFFATRSGDFDEARSQTRPLIGDGNFHPLAFQLPEGEQLALRLDPGTSPGILRLRRVALFENSGQRIGTISVSAFEAQHQVTIHRDPMVLDSITLLVPPGSDDPILWVNDSSLVRLLDHSPHVTKPAFIFAFTVLVLIIIASSTIAVRWCTATPKPLRRLQFSTGVGILLLIFGIRLGLISNKVSWAPYLDQFEGEWATVIRPFNEGIFRWVDFAAPHNDHRITTTRIFVLAAYLANGEWDNRVLAVSNCFLQSACIAWLCLVALRDFAEKAAVIIGLGVFTSLSLTDWSNIITGFQVQFHFLLLSSLMALTLMPRALDNRIAGWTGFAAGLFALGSMGSGFLALAAGVCGLLMRAWIERQLTFNVAALIVSSLAAVFYAWHTRALFPALDELHATSISHWFFALFTYGAWPLPASFAWAALLWTPWALLTWKTVAQRKTSTFSLFVITVGIWLLMQVGALAYGRAGYAPVMSSRYTGMLEWNGIVAVASLSLLFSTHLTSPSFSRFSVVFTGTVAAIYGAALIYSSVYVFIPQYKDFVAQVREHESRLGTFMRSDDPRVFSEVDFPRKPFPFDGRLVSLLRDPALVTALPAPLRREQFRFANSTAFAMVHAGPVTQLARSLLKAWPWLTGTGTIIIGLALLNRKYLLNSRLSREPTQ